MSLKLTQAVLQSLMEIINFHRAVSTYDDVLQLLN